MSASPRRQGNTWGLLFGALIVAAAVTGLVLWWMGGQRPGGWGGGAPRGQDVEDPEQLARLKEAVLPVPKVPASPGVIHSDWPQWRGVYRDGISRETGLLSEWPADLGQRKVWEQPAGAGYSALVVANGRACTIFQDGEQEAVVCWDALTGKELWRFRYPARYDNSYGNGPRSTPTIEGDRVYTVGGTGIMHCLSLRPQAATGEMLWRRDLLTDFGAPNLQWGVSFSPLVREALVFVNPGGPGGNSLAALNKDTGATVWNTGDDPAGYSSPVLATLAGRKQVVFFTGKGLVGVTVGGEVLWRYPWETQYGANIATPIIVGDYVFISSGYGRGCTVVKVEATGEKQEAKRVYEHVRMANHFSTCVLVGEHLYGFHDSLLTCMEFRTGKVRWKERGFDKGSLLVAEGLLIILGEQGKLALADASPEGYRERSSFTVAQGRCWTVPVLAQGRLYVRDETRVVCFDLRKQ
ncbi:MAG: PQQ-like beta-propeller repeat protein [Gemmataceae bacterium]|nr:PQQ-like beta-propeller repeat protein [Gemmataceae bacterium]